MNGLTIDFEEVKSLAAGKWNEILPAITSLPGEVLTKGSSDHPCPKCNGKSTIWPAEDAQTTGRIACRNCTSDRPTGDGVATVAAFCGISQLEAARAVAQYLGIKPSAQKPVVDIIDAVCRSKRMPRKAFESFGVVKAVRQGNPVVRVNLYNHLGEVHSHFDIFQNGEGKLRAGHGSSGLFFPGRLPAPGETWLIVEGVKDASALIAIGYNAAGTNGSSMPSEFARLFADVHVILVPDLDNAGQTGSQKTARRLIGVAADIHVARLPGEVTATKGIDCRDVLARDGGESALRLAIQDASPFAEDGTQRPVVVLDVDQPRIVAEVLRQLAKEKAGRNVFKRAGVLVDVIDADDATHIRQLPAAQLGLQICESVRLVREREKDGNIVHDEAMPPKWLLDAVLTDGVFRGVRELRGVVVAPTLRPDGSVLQEEGYDAATKLLYKPAEDFPSVPLNPSREDAQKAAGELLDVVADFPFVDDADRSAWLALVLTQIARPAVDGCAPMFTVSANNRGSGKSLVSDAASLIAYGKTAARKAYPKTDDECRKVITSVAIEALPSVLLDNIDRQLGGASLDAALTATTWNDRILGSNRTTGDLPMRTVWVATGNNLSLGTDIARRVLPIRLETPLENPEDRHDFKHSDLLGWIAFNRPQLAVAALTVLRAYFAADCPKQDNGTWGSFESWYRIVRSAIVWTGLADPMATRESAKAEDTSAAVVAGLIGGLIEVDDTGEGLTTRQIADKLNHNDNRDRFSVMRDVCVEIGCVKNGNVDAKRLGYELRKFRGRVCNGYCIQNRQLRAKALAWFAQKAGNGGDDGGDGGDPKTHHHQHHHHLKPSNLRDETHFGGDGGDTLLILTRSGISKTKTQNWNGRKTSPPSPPSPPANTCSPRCEPSCNPGDLVVNPDPSREGWTKTTCGRCGRYFGAAPTKQHH